MLQNCPVNFENSQDNFKNSQDNFKGACLQNELNLSRVLRTDALVLIGYQAALVQLAS